MKTPVDERLRVEATRFRLRFACDDCVHFDPDRDPTCGHGWPTPLRRSALDVGSSSDGCREESTLSFCKEFELA